MSSVLFTGGAVGADLQFATSSLRAGHTVRIMSFEGHKASLPKETSTTSNSNLHLERLSGVVLKAADAPLKQAGKKLARSSSGRTDYVTKLLQRNYFQARDVSSVYAVGRFAAGGRKDSVRIEGGTAWACQVFVDKSLAGFGSGFGEKSVENEARLLQLFFFSQPHKAWFQCKLAGGATIEWVQMESPPPSPQGKYAGIGTRVLEAAGKAAVMALFE